MATVVFSGSRADLARLIQRLPRLLAGLEPDIYGIARGLQLRLGVALLSKIQQDFITKARGGLGDDGIRWPPLKPATIARRRGGGLGGVEILRDTGELIRSFSPGVEDRPSGADGQVFELKPGLVRVGTNKKPWHHRGVKNKLPARSFWPLDGRLPAAWWRYLLRVYGRGLARALTILLSGGRRI